MQNGLAVDALELYFRMCCPDSGMVESNVVTVVGLTSTSSGGTCRRE
jgi:hypothetical protein